MARLSRQNNNFGNKKSKKNYTLIFSIINMLLLMGLYFIHYTGK